MPHSWIQVELDFHLNPVEDIWSVVQTRVGTPHKILKCLRTREGHCTFKSKVYGPMFKLWWGHWKKFKEKDRRGMFRWLADLASKREPSVAIG